MSGYPRLHHETLPKQFSPSRVDESAPVVMAVRPWATLLPRGATQQVPLMSGRLQAEKPWQTGASRTPPTKQKSNIAARYQPYSTTTITQDSPVENPIDIGTKDESISRLPYDLGPIDRTANVNDVVWRSLWLPMCCRAAVRKDSASPRGSTRVPRT